MTVTHLEQPSTGAGRLQTLLERIETRQATVGVVGLGYVGLPLALLFESRGFPVIGFDTDPEKPQMLAEGRSYIRHISSESIGAASASGRLQATTDFTRLRDCDAILICVPTPLGPHREPDLKYVRMTAEQIASNLRAGQLVVLESTTYPGTTREELLPRLSATGMTCGSDFFLAFSPEREDPGNERFSTRQIPKVVGGADEPSLRAASKLYEAAMDKIVPVASCEVAEAGKLLENIFRSVNIALVNELKVVFDRMNIDIWEVIEAAKSKPFGFMPFYPGPGVGGHCIPLDPFYLSWKAAEHGAWARFIELAGEINTSMPRYVVSKAVAALNQQGKSIRGAKTLVLGIAYKPDVDDYRESPSFEIVELLREMNAEVSYCDPYVPQVGRTRKHELGMSSVPCSAEEFARYDAIIIATAHKQFRDQDLYRQAQLVVDTQNVVGRDAGVPVTRA